MKPKGSSASLGPGLSSVHQWDSFLLLHRRLNLGAHPTEWSSHEVIACDRFRKSDHFVESGGRREPEMDFGPNSVLCRRPRLRYERSLEKRSSDRFVKVIPPSDQPTNLSLGRTFGPDQCSVAGLEGWSYPGPSFHTTAMGVTPIAVSRSSSTCNCCH